MPTGIYKRKTRIKGGWKSTLPSCFCGKKLSGRNYKFCRKHSVLKGENNPNWKGGKPKCEVCSKEIFYTSKHCKNHIVFTEEHKNKLKGRKPANYLKDRSLLKRNGEDNKQRRSPAYTEWSKSVKTRDNWKCKINRSDCSGRLESHHILNWREYPELRYKVNNGVALCHAHHPRGRAKEKRLIPYFKELVSVSKESI